MGLVLTKIRELPVIGILRGIREEHMSELADTIISSGLKTIEITMNTPHAPSLIKKMVSISEGDLLVGAGTVLNRQDLFDSLEAGAKFIVTPCINEEIVEYCYLNSVPVFPGALTPTEINKAWQLGATMVKVFPASLFGPGYFREIKAPLDKIELMAVGGVSRSTIAEYFSMGASAVAFGASIFKKEYLENSAYDQMKKEIRNLISAFHDWQNNTNSHQRSLRT
jgi:2-dehydro-3-deoxyphosphogluconate aldolase/(4S)-4-hydroxy-2-oxoglutarate aldolase